MRFRLYSRVDLNWVRRLVSDLEREGLNLWLDVHKLQPGLPWDSEIERALHKSNVLLVVLSEDSAKSPNVLDEVGFALSKNRLVVPVLYRQCEVPYRIARLQHVVFGDDYEGALKQLVGRLRAACHHDDVPTATAGAASHQVLPAPQVPAPPASGRPPARPLASAHAWLPGAVAGVSLAITLIVGGLWFVSSRGNQVAEPVTKQQPIQAPPAPAHEDGSRSMPAPAVPSRTERAESDAPISASRREIARPAPAVVPPPVANRLAPPSAEPRREPIVAPPAGENRAPAMVPQVVTSAPSPAPVVEASVVPAPTPARSETPAAAPAVDAPRPAASALPAPARPSMDDEAAIRQVINLYAKAIQDKNAGLLGSVRPSLTRADAQALIDASPALHKVVFSDHAISIDGGSASVRLTRQDVLTDAPPLRTKLVMTFAKRDGAWVIEKLQREK